MTSEILLIGCLMGTLASAGGATKDSPSFNWASNNGKSYLPPMEESIDSLDEYRCFERAVNAAMSGSMAATLDEPGYHINLSDQHIFQCSTNGYKCDSRNILDSVCEQAQKGVTDEACVPMGETSTVASCNKNNCADINSRLIKASSCGVLSGATETAIKEAILNYGPIALSMNFTDSFKEYTKGVYTPNLEEESIGTFMVTVTGWEFDNSLNHSVFIARNEFWGDTWGEKGFFKISTGDLAGSSVCKTGACFGMTGSYFDYSNVTNLPGALCIDETKLDLGDVNIYDPNNKKSITIRNCGQSNLKWSSVYSAPVQFNPPSGALTPGQTSTLDVSIDVESDAAVDGKLTQTALFKSTMTFPTELNIVANIVKPDVPVVDFSADVSAGRAPLVVNFTNKTKSSSEITKYEWTFGESSATSNKENPSYEYVKPGDYDVTLTITWAGGTITKEKKGLIAVYAPEGTNTDSSNDEKEDSGCNATSAKDLPFWFLLAIFFVLLPRKRLN